MLGERKIIEEESPTLAAGLPYSVVVTGARYETLPDALRQHITFGFGIDLLGEPLQSIRFPWSELNNRKVTLSFRPATEADEEALENLLPDGEITDISQFPSSIPAYLITVIPELKVEDEIVLAGTVMTLGEELAFLFTPEFAQGSSVPNHYNVIAGSYLAVAVVGGNISLKVLEDAKIHLEQIQTILESQSPDQLHSLTREDLLGNLFYAGLLSYYGQYIVLSHVAGLSRGGHHILAAGLGSYGYEPEVDYLFGFPRTIHSGGVAMNIPIVNVFGYDSDSAEARGEGRRDFVLQVGLLSSALEHGIPEQMFVTDENPGEAISAVKALSKANEQGQRIYHVTQENQIEILPNIQHDSSTMGEIRSALAVGKEVITHTNAVQVPGWSGAGYIIFDPDTGGGAYKIAGGANGSFLIFLAFLLFAAILMAPAIGFISTIAFLAGGLKAVAIVLSLFAALALWVTSKEVSGDLKKVMELWAKVELAVARALSPIVNVLYKIFSWIASLAEGD